MADMNNPLSPLSYTNKDFRDIYPELLKLVKKLTYKWDPTISNESDPGVILLKLNAIIGDKANYNIDKNILEVFPETLTQDVSARSIYHQLAYDMPWYKSAKTNITLKWVGKELSDSDAITIPQYTMVSDEDNTIVYTLLEAPVFTKGNLTTSVSAMQGIVTDLKVAGDTDIQLVNLDSDNKLYLDDYSVAQNGIFITNKGSSQLWEQVRNLGAEPLGNLYYEFGVDARTNSVYVKFPEDIDKLIDEGLNIKYLISEGQDGNVATNIITTFYDDISVTLGEETIKLNADSCVLYNPSAAKDGENPESIEDAYKSYHKVAGTFDTIITLRDYMNAIYNMEGISNVIVADRTNDIQDTYKVLTGTNTLAPVKTAIRNINGEPAIDAYGLKVYALKDVGEIDSINDFELTFEVLPSASTTVQAIPILLQKDHAVCHDFNNIEPDIPFLFRIAYPLTIKIVPQYKLTTTQQQEVQKNILRALMKQLNSRKVDFGVEPDYSIISDIVSNSEERIKLAIVDDFQYTTYATFWDNTQQVFKTIPINNYENNPFIVYKKESRKLLNSADVLNIVKNYFIPEANKLANPNRVYYILENIFVPDSGAISHPIYIYDYKTLEKMETGVSPTPIVDTDTVTNIRKKIITESILSGTTPLYNPVDTFDYAINQEAQIKNIVTASTLTTTLEISPFGGTISNEHIIPPNYVEGKNISSYTLKSNETLQFLAPSLKTTKNYSSYVVYQFQTDKSTENYLLVTPTDYNEDKGFYKYDSSTNKYIPFTDSDEIAKWKEGKSDKVLFQSYKEYSIPANTDYKLTENDCLLVFYTDSDATSSPYTYEKYTAGTIIKATFNLSGISASDMTVPIYLNPENFLDSGYVPYSNNANSTYSKISALASQYALTTTNTIDIRALNELEIGQKEADIYFITNTRSTENNVDYYNMVFSKLDGVLQYTLQVDEYFIHIDRAHTAYEILGEGTKLQLDTSADTVALKVEAIDITTIAKEGIGSFESRCIRLDYDLTIKEQQIYNLSEGDVVTITMTYPENTLAKDKVYPVFTGISQVIKNYDVFYSTDNLVFTSLPKFKIDNTSWTVKAVLNIDCSSNQPQVISNASTSSQSLQQIKFLSTSDETEISTRLDVEKQFILSDVAIHRVGGNNIDVTYTTLLGDKQSPNFYIYTEIQDYNKEPFSKLDNNIVVNIPQNKDIYAPIGLLSGQYILSFRNNSEYAINVDGGYIDSTSTFISTSTSLSYTNTGVAPGNIGYILLYIDESQNNQLWIHWFTENVVPTGTVEFLSLHKVDITELLQYTDNSYYISTSDIIKLIVEGTSSTSYLNYYQGTDFDFSHIVESENLIPDPIDGKSFFQNNHVFNKYAIAEAKLIVPQTKSNADKSNITIVNNR